MYPTLLVCDKARIGTQVAGRRAADLPFTELFCPAQNPHALALLCLKLQPHWMEPPTLRVLCGREWFSLEWHLRPRSLGHILKESYLSDKVHQVLPSLAKFSWGLGFSGLTISWKWSVKQEEQIPRVPPLLPGGLCKANYILNSTLFCRLFLRRALSPVNITNEIFKNFTINNSSRLFCLSRKALMASKYHINNSNRSWNLRIKYTVVHSIDDKANENKPER